MLKGQQQLNFSKYNELYSLIIPKDHLLKQIKDLVDFSFIYDELASSYRLEPLIMENILVLHDLP
jgi:hypothetical protein